MSLKPSVGLALPTRTHAPDNVQLMLYNAVLWNGHRIHFDLPYATEVEGYSGLVLAGPMLGDWLHQLVDEWLDDKGVITHIAYSNRGASYVGETLLVGGTITEFNDTTGDMVIEVFVKNESGEIVAPGIIGARLSSAEAGK